MEVPLPDLIKIAFGAALGCTLTLMGSIALDRAKMRQSRTSKLNALLAEMEDNILLSSNHSVGGGRAKQRLLTSMWEVAKGCTFVLTPDLQSALRTTYSHIAQYNSLVDYDVAKVPLGNGMLNAVLELTASTAHDSLVATSAILRGELGQNS
jgi:hypothetical protein